MRKKPTIATVRSAPSTRPIAEQINPPFAIPLGVTPAASQAFLALEPVTIPAIPHPIDTRFVGIKKNERKPRITVKTTEIIPSIREAIPRFLPGSTTAGLTGAL